MSILQDKIAGMTDQQAEKLSRELQEFMQLFGDGLTEQIRSRFPLLTWLYRAIKVEGTVAEQIHLCDACRRGNHKEHRIGYKDHDQNYWVCKCPDKIHGFGDVG